MHCSDWLHCVSALQSLGLHWSAYHLIHPMSSKTCIFFQICVPLCLGSAAILLYNLPQKNVAKKMWFTYNFLPWIARQYVPPEIPSEWCGMFLQRLPHRLNRLTGHLAARLMTKVATWLPGQGGDQGRRTAAQGGHVTHGERGVLYPGRLDHHLFVPHHNQPWPSPCQSRWTLQWRVFILTTWHSIALRREFADLNPTTLPEGIICGASTTIEGRSKLPRF